MMNSTAFLDGRVTLLSGDCFARLDDIPEGSVDAVCCDPPYHLQSIVDRFGGDDAAPATAKDGSAGAYARASAGFMGKTWDGGDIAFRPDLWAKVLRVLKPGGYVVAFSGTRTYHDMAVAIAAAGFEVRDNILNMLASDTAVVKFLESLSPVQVEAFFRCVEDSQFGGMLAWCYGTGFPKSHSVPKGIDDHLFRQWLDENKPIRARYRRMTKWAKRRDRRGISTGLRGRIETAFKRIGGFRGEFIGTETLVNDMRNSALLNVGKGEERPAYDRDVYSNGTPEAAEWDGWGTALKPAWEPICLARKPLESAAINVIGNIERQLRQRGVSGEILWSDGNASDASKSNNQKNLSSTQQPVMAETSAANAADLANSQTEGQTLKSSATESISGQPKIGSGTGSLDGGATASSATKSSPSMARPANVVERPSEIFSPSTTLPAAELPTENQSTEKFTLNCEDRASRPDTESFAGIATGLTGSTAHVLISRAADGSFVWPLRLPKFVPPSPYTVAANTLAHGTGGLNVGACRIDAEKATGWGGKASGGGTWTEENSGLCKDGEARPVQGRYPANIVTDGSAEVEAAFPNATGAQGRVSGREASASTKNTHGEYKRAASEPRGDAGSSVRFFYSAKADGDDRLGSKHPTVKPVDLMRWLVRLVCRKGGTVLDPFAGTGTTGEAAFWEGCNAILIEREEEYQRDIAKRMSLVLAGPDTKKRARTILEPAESLPLFGADTVAHVAKINGGGATGGSSGTSPKTQCREPSARRKSERANSELA